MAFSDLLNVILDPFYLHYTKKISKLMLVTLRLFLMTLKLDHPKNIPKSYTKNVLKCPN